MLGTWTLYCVAVQLLNRPWVAERPTGRSKGMLKKILELLICFLHPLAVVLIWINLAVRTDIGAGAKIAWAILSIIPLVPFVYVLTGNDLW